MTPIGLEARRHPVRTVRAVLRRSLAATLAGAACALTLGVGVPAAEAEPVGAIFNVPYGPNSYQRMDIYPVVETSPAPTVIVVHGGGWIAGGKNYPKITLVAEGLAAEGFAVFNINYRLATDTQSGIPMQTDDVASVVQWILDRGAQFGADPTRISLLGGSAGGQIVALAGQHINAQRPGTIRSVVTLSGPMDFEYMAAEQLGSPDEELRLGLPNYLGCPLIDCTPAQLQQPSPVRNVSSTSPPFLMANSDAEVIALVQAQGMHDALLAAGRPSTLRVFSGATHGFGLFRPAQADILRFLSADGSPPTVAGIPPGGTVGTPYTFAFDLTDSLTTTVQSGSLPAGVTLSTGGVIAGIPTESGDFTFTVHSAGYFGSAVLSSTLHVAAMPQVAVADVSVLEGDSDSAPLVFTVSLDAPAAQQVTVAYATVDATATQGSDYEAVSGTLTFPPGTTSLPLPVAVQGDLTSEPDETFTIELSDADGAVIADADGTATIQNGADVPLLSVTDTSIVEGDSGTSVVEFTVSLDAPAAGDVTVDVATVDGTATAGSDYLPAAGTLTFPSGVLSLPLPVVVIGDTAVEADETLTLELSNPGNAAVGDAIGTATLLNASDVPLLSVADLSTVEGDSGTTEVAFEVSLDAPSAVDVTVDYATADGTATAGSDYEPVTATATIPAGATSLSLRVLVIGDRTMEPDETFVLELSGALNAVLADASGTATVMNGPDLPLLSVDDVAVVEGDFGTTTATFTVSLDTPSNADVSVDFATQDETATAGVDYAAAAGTVTLPAATLSAPISVDVVGDLTMEAVEAFTLDLANASGAGIADASGAATILTDADLPRLTVDDIAVDEGDTGTDAAALTVSLDVAADLDVSVEFVTRDGTATEGVDYAPVSGTLTLPAGTTSLPVPFAVIGDLTAEPDETLSLQLASPVNAVLADAAGTATILSGLDVPHISVGDTSVVEGNDSLTTTQVTVSLDAPSAVDVTVDFSTADGTAAVGIDYQQASGTLTFPAGATSLTLPVSVYGDPTVEPDESFVLQLASPVNAAVTDETGNVTILNDPDLSTVSAVTPAVLGQGAVGRELTVSGRNFLPSSAVSFSSAGIAIVSSSFVDPSTIRVVVNVAAGAKTGPGAVTVTNTGLGSTTCADCFGVNRRPRATSAAPAVVTGAARQSVLVTGTGFKPGALVRITGHAGVTATSTSVSPTSLALSVTVSRSAFVGLYNLVVTNPDGGTSSCVGCVTVLSAPYVAGISTARAAVLGD